MKNKRIVRNDYKLKRGRGIKAITPVFQTGNENSMFLRSHQVSSSNG